MENITKIAELLGEDNVKKLKDGITDSLLKMAQNDIEEKYRYDYVTAFDDIFEEVKNEIKNDFKTRMMAIYTEKINKKIEEIQLGI